MIFRKGSSTMEDVGCGYGGIGRRARFRFWCLWRAGSTPVIRTTEKGPDWSLFSFCQSNWPSILLLLFKSFRFCQFFDLISTYPLLGHTFSEILWTPSLLTLQQVIRSLQISLTPPALTFLQVTQNPKFHWLLRHLLSCKSHRAPNFIDSSGAYFPASHTEPQISLTPPALIFL